MIEKYFRDFNVFSGEEIKHVTRLFTAKTLEKSEFFIKEGEKCNEIAFVQSGIFRSYYTTPEGNDITYCFQFPNNLMASYSSFITGNASMETMQAISKAELLIIKKEKIEKLVDKSHNWTRFLKIIAEQQYLELEKRVFDLQKDNALQRYNSLFQNQPEYIQEIPLQYLASYLGITPRHLSRIRKEVSL